MRKKMSILVVDDDRRMARTLVDILTIKGYRAEAAHSGVEALEKVKKGCFDCILSDIKMPQMNGVELYRVIKQMQPELPVVLMTAYAADNLARMGLAEGVIATITKPLDIDLLLSFFSALRKETSIVIVDDDPQFCKVLADILRRRGFKVAVENDYRGVVGTLGAEGQVVLLDMKLGDTNGTEVLKEIRQQFPHLPVIMVTGYGEEMAKQIKAALKINAYACLYKPFGIDELLKLLIEVHNQELGRILGRPANKKG